MNAATTQENGMRAPKRMSSKFAGKCARCSERFPAGATITWSRALGAIPVDCAGCNEDPGNRAERLLVEAEVAAASAPVVGDIAGIVSLFDTASEHLRYPKIRLQLRDGTPVVLSRAGDRAKRPGTINVTDGGRYGDNRWFGRIALDGTFEPGRDTSGHEAEITAILTNLASDPAHVAAEHGRLLGSCCFCAKALSDERSTAVGYGGTCAGHYGLPWGARAIPAPAVIVEPTSDDDWDERGLAEAECSEVWVTPEPAEPAETRTGLRVSDLRNRVRS